jgi:flagellar hook protein FlgE
MLRSLFAGISGLRAHQTMMDVTGNNIANVNTAGYKASQTVFQDTLSQMLTPAGSPQGQLGGTNPAQVGLGAKIAGIFTNFGQGASQMTGRSTDLMISGDGMFVVRQDGQDLYTRAGAFNFDSSGQLVTPNGGKVLGWNGVSGVVNTSSTPGPLVLPTGTLRPPVATSKASFGGNLPGNASTTGPITTGIDVYDAQGNTRKINASFTMTSPTAWNVTLTDGTTTVGPTAVSFGTTGGTPNPPTITFGGITVDISAMTSFAGQNTVTPLDQNGSTEGSLQAFSISPDGTLVGVFSNGLRQDLGKIAMANFNNPSGLEKVGGSMFRASVNSGIARLGTAGSGGRGTLSGGTLEMSNVDLSQEFTNLIVAQRGFQANSRVITASDEILQDLVNLKR